MVKEQLLPDYIFESSWEVCNKVGESIQSFRRVPRPYKRHFRIRLFSSVLIFGKNKRVLISRRIKPSLQIGKVRLINKGSKSG